jgi:hypothetical protein
MHDLISILHGNRIMVWFGNMISLVAFVTHSRLTYKLDHQKWARYHAEALFKKKNVTISALRRVSHLLLGSTFVY